MNDTSPTMTDLLDEEKIKNCQNDNERPFLHDVSNQLVIAQGMANFVYTHMKRTIEDKESKLLIRMEKSIKAINTLIGLTKERRTYVRVKEGLPPPE